MGSHNRQKRSAASPFAGDCTVMVEFCCRFWRPKRWLHLGKRWETTWTASVDCKLPRMGGVWKGSAAVVVRVSWRGFMGKVVVCMVVRRAGLGDHCATDISQCGSWKRKRTMIVEKLRVRKPVNNRRRNHRAVSREQLATVQPFWPRPRRKKNWTAPAPPTSSVAEVTLVWQPKKLCGGVQRSSN